MNWTKKSLKDEIDDCTKEFERQINELNLKLKDLSHKYVVLKNTKMENKTDRSEKLLTALHQSKDR
jgi:hypothetical protein